MFRRANKPECLKTFSVKDIHTNMKASDKYEAIRMAGQFLVDRGSVTPEYIDAMLKREELSTTYIGEGVAIPHGIGASRSCILRSGLTVMQFPEGVPFEDELAYLVIGIAGTDDEHLPVLQALTGVMLDEEKLQAMKTTTNPKVIYQFISEAES